jgi:hypothetical protein
MPRRRSILKRLAGLVLLASTVTVVTCLLLAWQRPEGQALANPGPWTAPGSGERRWVVQGADSFGGTAITRYVAPANWPGSTAATSLPWWSRAWDPPTAAEAQREEQAQGDRRLTEVAYGWPFRAMKYQYTWTTHPMGFSGRLYYFDSMSGGVLLGQPGRGVGSAAWYGELRALPLRPIPLGFALNVLLLCAVIAVPPWLHGMYRRRRRRRRGLCGICGYDLRGHAGEARTCPECGSPEGGRGPWASGAPAERTFRGGPGPPAW